MSTESFDRRRYLRTVGTLVGAGALGTATTETAVAAEPSRTTQSAEQNSTATRTLLVDGRKTEGPASYAFAASGSVEAMSDPRGDTVRGGQAEGTVWNWIDGYRVTGEVTAFQMDGDAVVSLGGERVDPADLGSSLPNTVAVVGREGTTRADYEFSVDDQVVATKSGDDASDGTASGSVWNYMDVYRFSGEITEFSHDGPLAVEVNGSEVDPSSLGSDRSGDGNAGGSSGGGSSGGGSSAGGSTDGNSDGGNASSGSSDSGSNGGGSNGGSTSRSASTDETSDGGSGGSSGGSLPFETRVERAIHARINDIRRNRGLEPLSYSQPLAQIAAAHSRDMVADDYFAHTSPDGVSPSDRYDRFGVDCNQWSENIAYNSASDRSAAAAARKTVDQWMHSSGHRRNILDSAHASEGLGVVTSGGQVYATQNFGANCR